MEASLSDNPIVPKHQESFEDIRQEDEAGNERWSSRDFARVLDYTDYRNFEQVIEKAKIACANSKQTIEDHFVDVNEMVGLGSKAQRVVKSIFLSRYACYLVIQNADPTKDIVAHGQTYFAIQTRRQELADGSALAHLDEDGKRLAIRNELAAHNRHLAAAAQAAGVETPVDYAIFQDHGYRGLYGGLGNRDIHARKGLKKSHKILDHMGSTELAANLFRATQTEDKLQRDGIQGKDKANQTHLMVGQKVRQTIKELGGTMPENLPTPEKSIRQIETAKKKLDDKK